MSNSLGGYTTVYLNVNVAAADTELVAAISGKRIRVNGFILTNDAAATVKMSFVSDGSSDTEILSFNTSPAAAVAPIVAPPTPYGYCETLRGEALDLRQTTTDDIDGVVIYSIVD